ncbi:MAG: hypothetical protein KGR48_12725 [Alphaproteobacteria bacterium]|nr:hypothetical protein [Alphaproteobacteria bacterium]MDE2012417.1 hypothetical protein [Alphaproteobacteria bacterium]MDE2072055.1 hypothetical protein [Alphaproteobacteria bacterium]MDE2350774.1 hypothetical protein [Alphaproteobacteria bacterium]
MVPHRIGFSEGKACDAVMRVLEAREQGRRENLSSPEEQQHRAPIELMFTLNGQAYAMEHTGIEPFPGHVELTARIIRDLVPIQDMIAQQLKPSEHIYVEVPEAGLRSLKKADVRAFQDCLVRWVVERIPSEPTTKMGRYPTPYEPHVVPGVSFPVWLHRMETLGHPAFVRVSVQIDDFNRELEREKRIRKAFEDKFPKLRQWKEAGARTVLVLEDNDIQFTNQSVVAEGVNRAISGMAGTPDEIWLVISCTDPWFVFPMLIDGRPHIEFVFEMHEFDPSKLEKITRR